MTFMALRFRRWHFAVAGGAIVAALLAIVLTSGELHDDGSDRRRTTLQELSEAELDRIVVQLQDPKLDRLSPSVVDDYRDALVRAGDDPQGSREPMVVLRSDGDDGSIWDSEWFAAAAGMAVLTVLLLAWRKLRRERPS